MKVAPAITELVRFGLIQVHQCCHSKTYIAIKSGSNFSESLPESSPRSFQLLKTGAYKFFLFYLPSFFLHLIRLEVGFYKQVFHDRNIYMYYEAAMNTA